MARKRLRSKMTQVFVPRKYDVLEKRTFEVATAAILMGKQVELNSDGNIILATDAGQAIGIVDNMPDYRAENETGTVAIGDIAQVALFGVSFKGLSGGTFTAGGYVKPVAGVLVTSATATGMIAVTTSTAAGQLIDYIVKSGQA